MRGVTREPDMALGAPPIDRTKETRRQDSVARRANLSPHELRVRGFTVPGTIVRRGNSYALKLYAGQECGKQFYKWFTFRTFAEAQAAQAKLGSHIRAHAAGLGLFGSPRERLGSYLLGWLELQRAHLAPGTYERYRQFVTQIRQDEIGTVPLGRLSPRALEGYYTRRLAAGLSPTTVNHHHRMLHKAFRDAERQDLIIQNPASAAQAPRRVQTRPDVWTESETLLFLAEAKASSVHYPVYLFIAGTGARVGEALGLAWADIDLRESVAYIDQALQRIRGGGYLLKNPKSVRSRRPIALPSQIVDVLRDLRDRQDDQRQGKTLCERGASCTDQACFHWHSTGLVFTQPNGKPLHANNIRQRDLKRLCQTVGLSRRRALHNLRHAHGTYLLHRGVSLKVIQERLGHASAQFTLSTYAHVLKGMQGQAAHAISAMLNGQVPRGQGGDR